MSTQFRLHARAFLLVFCLLLPACRLTHTAPPTTNPAIVSPRPIPGIKNFAQVAPTLYRGAQPTRQGFIELQKRGIKTIVSLRSGHSDREDLKGLGFRYIRIPSKASKPNDQDLAKVLRIIRDPANQPVFVHCHIGADRTGFAIAAYRIVEQGWPHADATAEMDHFKFNHLFQGILEHLRRLDPAQMKQTLASMPSARLEVVE